MARRRKTSSRRVAEFRKQHGADLDRFIERVVSRLEKGAVEYEGASFSTRRLSEVAGELAEELEDVSGWSFVLWQRVRALRKRLPRTPTIWTMRSRELTAAGRQVWEYLFEEPMPESITLRWVPYLRNRAGQADVGAIHRGGVAQFDWSYLSQHPQPMRVLVHEFAHLRGFDAHGKKFTDTVARWCATLSIPPEPEEDAD